MAINQEVALSVSSREWGSVGLFFFLACLCDRHSFLFAYKYGRCHCLVVYMVLFWSALA